MINRLGLYHPDNGYWECFEDSIPYSVPDGTVEFALKPSRAHEIDGNGWTLNTELRDTLDATDIRTDRDFRLVSLDEVVASPLRWAAFSADQQSELSTYRQALLDVPQQDTFPSSVVWPEAPDTV